MSTAKRIARNTGFLLASEIVRKVIFFVLVVYATRVLGKVGWGRFSFALAYTYLFTVVIDIGLSVIATREVARKRH
ncbi:MAG: oligosaccharide flippase family protein, partial [Candidatus Altiarchaeota archaeon]